MRGLSHKHSFPEWTRHCAVAIFSGLLVVVMTAPAIFNLSTKLIGNNVDNWIFYWNNWWLQEVLAGGHRFFATPYLFYPQGASLVAHSNSLASSLLALPLTGVVGPVAASNLVLLLGLWIGCLGMFYLVRYLTGNAAAGLVAAWVFTFAPYRFTQVLSHAHLGSLHWWPLFALFLHRSLKLERWKDAVFAGIAFALTLWTGLQLAVMVAMWGGLYVLYSALTWVRPLWNRSTPSGYVRRLAKRGWIRLRLLALVAGVGCLLSAPLLIPIAREWRAAWTEGFELSSRDQTDLLAYVMPPTYNPLVGPSVQSVYERFVANRAYMPYLGLATMVLALLALSQFRVNSFWFLTFLLWMLLAAGSVLRFNGVVYSQVRLPYRWVSDLFPFSTLRSPDRFNLLLVFTLAVLAGYGIARIRRRAWLLPLALLMVVEYIPVPILQWDLLPSSPFYAQMRQQPADYGVIDYPMGYDESKLWLYYQTLHGKPSVEGHVSRYTPDQYAYILSDPLLRALYKPLISQRPSLLPSEPFDGQIVPLPNLGPALRDLSSQSVRYLLVHRPYVDADLRAYLRHLLPLAPFYQDEALTVYDLTAPALVAYDGLPHPLSAHATLLHFSFVPRSDDSEWEVRVIARADESLASATQCEIRLAEGVEVVARIPLSLFPLLDDDGTWEPGDLDYQVAPLSLPAPLPSGRYVTTLSCEDSTPYQLPDALDVDESGSAVHRRTATEVVFDEDLPLVGYRWHVEGAELKVTLWWHPLVTPDAELMVFVHLLDAEGNLVAQYDAIPCEWLCPTQTWESQSLIADRATLDLGALSDGTYQLAVGLYHPGSMQRLTAQAGSTLYADGYVQLPDSLTIRWIGK